MKTATKNEAADGSGSARKWEGKNAARDRRAYQQREMFLCVLSGFGGRVKPAMQYMGWKDHYCVLGRLKCKDFRDRYWELTRRRKSRKSQRHTENVTRNNVRRAFDAMVRETRIQPADDVAVSPEGVSTDRNDSVSADRNEGPAKIIKNVC